MTVFIGTDHAGFAVKDYVKEILVELGHKVEDMGPFDDDRVDYPDYAKKVAKGVMSEKDSMGVLICGTGIGISIAANKVQGIRAGLCHDTYTAKATREHNDANILCFGERVVGRGVIKDMVEIFLSTEFAGGRHADRVNKIEGCSFGSLI